MEKFILLLFLIHLSTTHSFVINQKKAESINQTNHTVFEWNEKNNNCSSTLSFDYNSTLSFLSYSDDNFDPESFKTFTQSRSVKSKFLLAVKNDSQLMLFSFKDSEFEPNEYLIWVVNFSCLKNYIYSDSL